MVAGDDGVAFCFAELAAWTAALAGWLAVGAERAAAGPVAAGWLTAADERTARGPVHVTGVGPTMAIHGDHRGPLRLPAETQARCSRLRGPHRSPARVHCRPVRAGPRPNPLWV